MKTLRNHSLRFLLLTGLWVCLTLLAGCATTADKDANADNPEAVLAQAKQAYQEQQYQEVFQLLYPLAVKGNGQAQYVLGYLYYYGLGLEKNEQQAMAWIQRAAAQGNEKALQALQ
jgi:TPR repeat protein